MRFFGYVLLVLSLVGSPVLAGDRLHLVSPAAPPLSTDEGTGILDRIAAEAFRRLDIQITVRRQHQQRSMASLNSGSVDGIVVSAEAAFDGLPSAVVVREPITEGVFVAVAPAGSVDWKGPLSLEKARFAYRRGISILDQLLGGYSGKFDVTDAIQLVLMLERDRIDVGIMERRTAIKLLGKTKNSKLEILDPPVAVVKGYLILHQKHAGLRPGLEKALAAMKRDGTYMKIAERAKPSGS